MKKTWNTAVAKDFKAKLPELDDDTLVVMGDMNSSKLFPIEGSQLIRNSKGKSRIFVIYPTPEQEIGDEIKDEDQTETQYSLMTQCTATVGYIKKHLSKLSELPNETHVVIRNKNEKKFFSLEGMKIFPRDGQPDIVFIYMGDELNLNKEY